MRSPNTPPSSSLATSRARRLRPATSSVLGGASSLLRLAQPAAAQRLPSGSALDDWAQRASSMMGLFDDMVAVGEDAPSALVTSLEPSPTLRSAAGLR